MLGPLAVAKNQQSRGIGGSLMRIGLAKAAGLGHRAVLLVGDAPYYARFDFTQRLTDGLWMPGPYERERFLGLELVPGALAGSKGLVQPTGERILPLDLWQLMAGIVAEEARRAA